MPSPVKLLLSSVPEEYVAVISSMRNHWTPTILTSRYFPRVVLAHPSPSISHQASRNSLCRWTEGHSLRRRVDSIAEAISQGFNSGNSALEESGGVTRCTRGEEHEHKQEGSPSEPNPGEDLDVPSFHPVGGSAKQRPRSAMTGQSSSGDDKGENGGPMPAVAAGSIALAGEGAADSPGVSDPNMAGDSGMAQPTGSGPRSEKPSTGGGLSVAVGDVETSQSVQPCGVEETSDAPGRSLVDDTMSATPPAANTFVGATNSTSPFDGDERLRKPKRFTPRPASAPGRPSAKGEGDHWWQSSYSSSSVSVSEIRRSVSSPGFMEGGHHPGRSLVAIVDIAVESGVVLGRRQSRAVRERAAALVSDKAAFDSGNAPPKASHSAGYPLFGDGCEKDAAFGEGGREGRGEEEGDEGSTPKSKPRAECFSTYENPPDSTVALEENTKVKGASGEWLPRSGGGPKFVAAGGAAANRIGCESKARFTMKTVGGHGIGAEVESPLDFYNATVKLKVILLSRQAQMH